jgi:hypothetical protein
MDCTYDAEGYSPCCNAYRDVHPDTGDVVLKTIDPAKRKSSRYRGVTRVVRATANKIGYRVQISRNGRKHYLGEYGDEVTAAKVYDNVVHYLDQRKDFFTCGLAPALNFPEAYEYADIAPKPFMITARLIRWLTTH